MGNRRDYLIKELVWVCGRLDCKGLVANHDGNVTVRCDGNLLATPTAESKGRITEDMVITLDMEGRKVAGPGNPFSEIKLHLSAYRARDDIRAVVHAHPPHLTARGLVGAPLLPSLPEAVVSIGDKVPVVSFTMPGAPESDGIISQALMACDIFMIPGNGVLAVGSDLEQAYLRLELAEHLAAVDYYARSLGKPMTLSSENLGRLLEKRASIGLGPKKAPASPGVQASNPAVSGDPLQELIGREIRKILLGE